MNARAFDRVLQAALARIPAEFRQAIRDIPVVVEDWPDPELMREATGDPEAVLYGYFDGVPLTERSVQDPTAPPPVIRIFRGPLLEDFPLRQELEEEIEVTLVHEIAHLMGLDEEQIGEYGYE